MPYSPYHVEVADGLAQIFIYKRPILPTMVPVEIADAVCAALCGHQLGYEVGHDSGTRLRFT